MTISNIHELKEFLLNCELTNQPQQRTYLLHNS